MWRRSVAAQTGWLARQVGGGSFASTPSALSTSLTSAFDIGPAGSFDTCLSPISRAVGWWRRRKII
jgi:hypothetical protein